MNDILRDKLKNANVKAPEYVIHRIDETLEKLPGCRKKNKLKYAAVAAGTTIVITVGIGVVNPSFAKNIPIINSVFKYLYEKEALGEEYIKFAKGVNKSVTDKGFTVTINEVVCDESSINIAYTIKSEKKFSNNEVPHIFMKLMRVNGKDLYAGSGGTGEFIDEYTYAGIENIDVGREKIPQNFKFDYNIKNIKDIEGNWDFKFYISREDTDKLTKSFNLNYKHKLNNQELTIEKVSFTPLNTTLIIKGGKADKAFESDNGMMEFDEWCLFDDKGRQIQSKGAGGSGEASGFKYEIHYDKINEIPKYLTVIPINHKKAEKAERAIKEINSNFPLKINQGRIGSITIKSIEFLQNKTVVNYSVEGFLPLEQAGNLFLIDENNKEIWSEDRRGIKYSDNNNYIMTFKALDKNKKYKIGTINYDSWLDVREDLKFNIPIQEQK